MDRFQGQVRGRVDPAGGQVEHSPASDRHQLLPVAEQRHTDLTLVGDGKQGACGVLLQHPGPIDNQQVPGMELGVGCGARVDAARERAICSRVQAPSSFPSPWPGRAPRSC